MNRRVFWGIVVLLIACNTYLLGQHLTVGARLGAALNGFTGADGNIPGFSGQHRLGFTGGAYANISAKRWQYAYFGAELLVTTPKGFVYDGALQRSRATLTYLEIPIWLGLRARPQRSVPIRLYGGIVTSLCVAADRVVQDKTTGSEAASRLNIGNSPTADVRPWDYSLAGGIGVDLKLAQYLVSADVRYQQSFSTISPAQNPSPTTLNQSVYFVLGFGWRNKKSR